MRIIRGKYGRRRFDVPRNITARPTTDFARENIFNVMENLVDFEGKRGLDLFAGTGAVSLEMLSRGCSSVTAVESAKTQADFIKSVAARLGDPHLKVIRGDVFRFLSSPQGSFDIVFADPPYDHERFGEVPRMVLESGILAPGALFVQEHSKKHDFSSLPHFLEHRAYGSVNFSIFRMPENEESNTEETDE